MIGISLPGFWFGLLLQMIFAVGLGWLPSSGRATPGGGDVLDHVQHLLLPTVVLAVVLASGWSRYLRGSMLETLPLPFIVSAQARGLSRRRVVLHHALRNALGPLIAIVTVDAALLVSGASSPRACSPGRASGREAFYQLYLQPRAGPGTCPAFPRDDGASLGKFAVPLARRDLLPPIAIERLGINNELSSLKYADPEQPMREGFRLSVRIDSPASGTSSVSHER